MLPQLQVIGAKEKVILILNSKEDFIQGVDFISVEFAMGVNSIATQL